ncbi:MAG: TIGR02678 family protein [Acidimicrobiales bacterium]
MAESLLTLNLADERATAVRTLLVRPLLDADADRDAFRLVARHAGWLTDWFERACGWALTVDPAGGWARLAKRAATVDATRPLRRTRGTTAPFDRRRYQLLCLVCAELVRHPVTTVGLLAGAVTRDAGLDTARHGERAALVDALRALMAWGAVRATAGDVDAYVGSEAGNAILTADTARLHRLLVSATAPSALPEGTTADEAMAGLVAEPRYGDAAHDPATSTGTATNATPTDILDESRHRWARHSLARRLLDQPVVHLDELSPPEADYLATPSGRKWLRERVAEAGFELEERAEGLLAADPDAVATDRHFPAPLGNAHQLALLLADRLVTTDTLGRRNLGRLTARQLQAETNDVFARFPSWARGRRDEGRPERLAEEAVYLLAAFGLARLHPDGAVEARPALARYRVGDPVVSAPPPRLFDQQEVIE